MPALCILSCGCAGIPDAVRDHDAESAIELVDTPFYPQERYQCGPAALTTALTASGAPVTLADIERKVFLPGKAGSLQVELLAATRTSGRLPYVIDGTLSAIVAELEAMRPVIVLQNLGVAAFPRWHYAVVVGVDPERDEIVLRSGNERRRLTKASTFLRTWRRSDYWAIVVLRPDEMPARVDAARYFEAIAALEQAGRLDEALIAWRAALNAWPRHPVPTFGLANVHFAFGRYADAERLYRSLLDQQGPSSAVQNNLAIALAKQARVAEATRMIDRALESDPDPALVPELRDTRTMIEALRSVSAEGPRP